MQLIWRCILASVGAPDVSTYYTDEYYFFLADGILSLHNIRLYKSESLVIFLVAS